jgi:alkaline phosphatase
MITTFSANSGVTDSAAAGTALATGKKTNNSVIGLEPDLKTPANSIAEKAKEEGMRVGVATSVTIDHATPSSFYAHVPNRNSSYQIGQQLISTGFDFYAGSDFSTPSNRRAPEEGTLYEQSEKAGYTIARGYKEYQKKARKADKMILFQTEEASKRDRGSIPYAIDREKGDLSLTEITRAGLNFLSKDLSKGFFLMVEGGKIDYACHANDAATVLVEIEDFDNAIRVAYEFYEQHPDETLIVVTADHETGGFVLGNGQYALNLQALKYQRMSVSKLSSKLNELRKKTNNKVSWEMTQKVLSEHFGLFGPLKLNKRQEERIRKAYDENFQNQEVAYDASMYQKDERLATVAKEIINEIAMVGWISGSHSNGYVPVYSIGVGAEKFSQRADNTDIPKKIAEAAGW